MQWLTKHDVSSEHDLSSGLRDHFDPRARWRSAIGSVRAIGRFANANKAKRKPTSTWSDDDDDEDLFPAPSSALSNKSGNAPPSAGVQPSPVGKEIDTNHLDPALEEAFDMPGSFDLPRSSPTEETHDTSWSGLFNKLRLV